MWPFSKNIQAKQEDIIDTFREEMRMYKAVILGEVKQGKMDNRDEVLALLNELLEMQKMWKKIKSKPGENIKKYAPKKIEQRSIQNGKDLASVHLDILNPVIDDVMKELGAHDYLVEGF